MQTNGDNFFPLDDETIAWFADGIKKIDLMQAQMAGALQFYIHQHKLEGNWRLADNGREIQRMPDPVPAR